MFPRPSEDVHRARYGVDGVSPNTSTRLGFSLLTGLCLEPKSTSGDDRYWRANLDSARYCSSAGVTLQCGDRRIGGEPYSGFVAYLRGPVDSAGQPPLSTPLLSVFYCDTILNPGQRSPGDGARSGRVECVVRHVQSAVSRGVCGMSDGRGITSVAPRSRGCHVPNQPSRE